MKRIRVSMHPDGMTVKSIKPVTPIQRPPSLRLKRTIQQAHRKRLTRNALVFTAIVHLIGAFAFVYLYSPHPQQIDDSVAVEFVNEVLEKRKIKPEVKPKPVKVRESTTPVTAASQQQVKINVQIQSKAAVGTGLESLNPTTTLTTPIASAETLPSAKGTSRDRPGAGELNEGIDRGSGIGDKSPAHGTGSRGSGFDSFRKGNGAGGSGTAIVDDLSTRVADDQLGAILEGTAQQLSGHIRIIRLKHSLSDWWQDPTAIPSFAKWLQENTQLRVDMTYAGGHLSLTDDRILNAPLVIMTGHDTDIATGRNLNKDDGPLATGFTSTERAQLRKYIIEREGMLFYDDCGFNGNFAAIVQNELQRTFPEYPLNNIDHTHELYTVYYQLPRPPRGGDVFWGNLNTGDSGGYFATESQFRYQKGIIINRRLAILFNRKDYLCTMETAEVGSRALLRMRRSNDVHRFMTNLLIYQMRYGGNTDRSNFKR